MQQSSERSAPQPLECVMYRYTAQSAIPVQSTSYSTQQALLLRDNHRFAMHSMIVASWYDDDDAKEDLEHACLFLPVPYGIGTGSV
jgi:hypothetical protein